MVIMTVTAARTAPERRPAQHHVGLGLPVPVVAALVLLAAPRAVVHDLQLLAPGGLAAAVLALVPLLVWVAVAVLWSARPLTTLVTAGLGYGAVLAVVHNVAWGTAFAGVPPRLGGNLEGAFSTFTEEIVMRGAASISSLATGALIGAVCGLIAWGVQTLVRRSGTRLPLARG